MIKGTKKALASSKDKLKSLKIKQSVENITTFSSNFTKTAHKRIDAFAKKLSTRGVKANMVSILGFVIGMFAVNFLALEMYGHALFCIILNRIFDILDGAIARHTKVTDFGIFLDSSLDYIFYAGVIFGFALANPEDNALSAAFLLFCFAASACSMLSYAVIAYKNKALKQLNQDHSPFYLGGLAQGFETIISLAVLCVVPFIFTPIAIILGILCLFKAFTIIATAYYTFVIAGKPEKE